MKAKLVHPEHAIGMLDPVTRRSPFFDYEKKTAIVCADIPDNNHWRRRVLAGELELELVADAPAVIAAKTVTTSEG